MPSTLPLKSFSIQYLAGDVVPDETVYVDIPDGLDEELLKYIGPDKRFKTYDEFFTYLSKRYIQDRKNDEEIIWFPPGGGGMALHLPGEIKLDPETRKKMRKELGLDDEENA